MFDVRKKSLNDAFFSSVPGFSLVLCPHVRTVTDSTRCVVSLYALLCVSSSKVVANFAHKSSSGTTDGIRLSNSDSKLVITSSTRTRTSSIWTKRNHSEVRHCEAPSLRLDEQRGKFACDQFRRSKCSVRPSTTLVLLPLLCAVSWRARQPLR